jgi:hypothetical protein
MGGAERAFQMGAPQRHGELVARLGSHLVGNGSRGPVRQQAEPVEPPQPALNPGELEKVMGEYVFNPVPGTKQFSVQEPLEVLEIGTGYMMVKREVFEVYKEKYPEKTYKPDHVGQPNFDGSRYIHAFFDTEIDTPIDPIGRIATQLGVSREAVVEYFPPVLRDKLAPPPGRSDRYLSEDYMFCQRWRALGGQVWLCPWMKTKHIGTFPFAGDMQAIAQMTGSL